MNIHHGKHLNEFPYQEIYDSHLEGNTQLASSDLSKELHQLVFCNFLHFSNHSVYLGEPILEHSLIES